jgi:hypothetical protein
LTDGHNIIELCDEAHSKVAGLLNELPELAAFAHGFIETGANAKPILKVTGF